MPRADIPTRRRASRALLLALAAAMVAVAGLGASSPTMPAPDEIPAAGAEPSARSDVPQTMLSLLASLPPGWDEQAGTG